MTLFDPDEWQDTVRSPQPNDDDPVVVTYYQALKCAAVVEAYTRGHLGYADTVRTVTHFWRAAAARAVHPDNVMMRPSLEDAWQVIDAAPWPLPGPPRKQVDT